MNTSSTQSLPQSLPERLVFPLVLAVLVLGTLVRLWPVAVGQPQLSEFYMTEDGYLLLTVARNIALGLGMTVSDATIPTNGVQPLITFIYTLPYLATGGDKVTSLIGVHLLATAIALGAAFSIRAFASHVFRALGMAPIWAWAVAALWFISPIALRHTMNGLETGLYVLCATLTLATFARLLEAGQEAGLSLRLWLGALTGITFLARIDGAFLAVAIFLIWAAIELFSHRRAFAEVVMRLLPPGLLSLAIAAPWLLNNQLRFGSIMPISGSAQSITSVFGQNAHLLPSKLFELFFPMLPVPRFLETEPVAIALFIATILAVGVWGLWRVIRAGGVARWVILAYLMHGCVLAFYYGFNFGAPHFLARYMAVLAPLAITLSLISFHSVFQSIPRVQGPALTASAVAAGLLLSLGLVTKLVVDPYRQGHEQVVAWISENVPPETWVAAVQTGTLGYWHDRTINLDGKVNPEALRARIETGDVYDYIVDSKIDIIADWNGIAAWPGEPGHEGFSTAFELIVDDPRGNLAVFNRRAASQ